MFADTVRRIKTDAGERVKRFLMDSAKAGLNITSTPGIPDIDEMNVSKGSLTVTGR